MEKWTIFGLPVFGVILPFIGKRRIPLNRDGSFVDTGEFDIIDEKGFYYVEPWVFEWLGRGCPLSASLVHLSATGEVVTPEFQVAGDD
jgi:hypothetical protein